MPYLHSKSEFAQEVMRNMGLDPSTVARCEIVFAPDEIIHANVIILVDPVKHKKAIDMLTKFAWVDPPKEKKE